MVANPLIGYAFLKANLEENVKDPLDLLVPAMNRVLLRGNFSISNIERIKISLIERWGFDIPAYTVRLIIGRMQGKKLISVDSEGNILSLMDDEYKDKIKNIEDECYKDYNFLSKKIKEEVIKSKSSASEKVIIEDFLNNTPVSFLSNKCKSTKITKILDESIIIISRCLNIGGDVDEDFAEKLFNVISGNLLYQGICAISEGDALSTIESKMDNVVLFLDTRILFKALGFFGRSEESYALEMILLMQNTGCKVKTFYHSVDELKMGIDAFADRLNSGTEYGELVEYCIENGADKLNLKMLSYSIEEKIGKLGIDIVDAKSIDESIAIDEAKLNSLISTYLNQKNDYARARDVKSLSSIYYMRQGKPKTYLEKSDFIFITSNKSLEIVSNLFFRELFSERGERNIVQLCMRDTVITSLLWLKVPTKFKDIPRKTLIAHAKSMLSPRADVMEKFINIIKEKIKSGSIMADVGMEAIFSQGIRASLVLETDNKPQKLTGEVIDNLLSCAISSIQNKMKAAQEEGFEKGQASKDEAIKELDLFKRKLQDLEDSNIDVNKEKYENHVEEIERCSSKYEAIKIIESKLSSFVSIIIMFIIGVVFLFCVFIKAIDILFSPIGDNKVINLFCVLVASTISFLSAYNIKYINILCYIRNMISKIISRILIKLLCNDIDVSKIEPSFKNGSIDD